jgi:hypothetical protein
MRLAGGCVNRNSAIPDVHNRVIAMQHDQTCMVKRDFGSKHARAK